LEIFPKENQVATFDGIKRCLNLLRIQTEVSLIL
jgi:hypothetical protein